MPLLGSGASGRARSKGRLSWGPLRSILAAAAANVSSRNGSGKGTPLLDLHQPWQAQAFGYYNRMGECWNPANFTARAMSKVRLFVATGTPDDPEELETGDAVELVKAWQHIPEKHGRLISLIGEGRLAQFRDPMNEDQLTWDFLSPVELKKDHQGKIIRKWGNETLTYTDISDVDGAGDPSPGQIRLWRFWRAHPENSGFADSAFRGVLDLYEQLWWLTLSERAELRNRVVDRGLLLIPEEIDFEVDGAESQALGGEDPDIDPFSELIFRVVTAALQDPGSAAAAAPVVVRAEAELLHPEMFRWLRLSDPSNSLFVTGREDAILRRISIGLDMPQEAYMGMGTLNHWNAWKLDDEKFQHVEPTIAMLCDDLTNAVLRPIARASNWPQADEMFIGADVAALVSDPDKGKTAIVLYQERLISGEAARAANDFDEGAAMTDPEEIEAWRLDHGVAAESDEDPELNEEPPDEDDEPTAEAEIDGEAVVITRERFAMAAMLAGRATAATWVRSKRRSCPECFEGIDPDEDLFAQLGEDTLRSINVRIVDAAAKMRDGFYRACGMFGVSFPLEEAARVEAHFAETLFDPAPFPRELAERVVL